MSHRTARRVPEFAVLTGVFLGTSAAVAALTLGAGLYAAVVACAIVAYPFVAFGVVRDGDPAATLRPRWVLAAGAALAALGAFGALLDDPTPSGALFAALVALALVAPPAAYATRHGASVVPLAPRTTVFVGAGAGLALVAIGLALGSPLVGVAAGAIAALGAALYGTARGVDVDPRTKRLAAVGGGLLGVAVVGVGVVRGERIPAWLLVGTVTALVPSLYVALSRRSTRPSRR
ncbi:MAG: hypothetical protein ABEK02_09155 [Haloquadratum sp.]